MDNGHYGKPLYPPFWGGMSSNEAGAPVSGYAVHSSGPLSPYGPKSRVKQSRAMYYLTTYKFMFNKSLETFIEVHLQLRVAYVEINVQIFNFVILFEVV